MRSRLVARMRSASPHSLKRNWNRWLHCGETRSPHPTVANLVAIARSARDLGWLEKPMDEEARSLAEWLLVQERKQSAEKQVAAAQVLNTFLDDFLGEVDFRLYDVEASLEVLFSTFATGVARHVKRASAPGGQGLSEAVRNGAERALTAASEALVELADAVEADEFAPVAALESADFFHAPDDAELLEGIEGVEPTKAFGLSAPRP